MQRLKLHKSFDQCKSKIPKLAVVMIHGIASDSSTYRSALEYLSPLSKLEAVRFIAFDLLGSGKSIKNDALNYDYKEQLSALYNSITDLNLGQTPLVLVGHSLGSFIVTRYASLHPGDVSKLILISPPVYTERDFDNPAFAMGIEAFKKAISIRSSHPIDEKAFTNSMQNIVLDRRNYSVLAQTIVPVTIIYGAEDQLIASHNIPQLLKDNHQIVAIKTMGRHGITRDKYCKIPEILEPLLNNERKEA